MATFGSNEPGLTEIQTGDFIKQGITEKKPFAKIMDVKTVGICLSRYALGCLDSIVCLEVS